MLTDVVGRNLLDDPAQEHGFLALLGIGDYKPFECVGETDESRVAVRLLHEQPRWASSALVPRLVEAVRAHGLAVATPTWTTCSPRAATTPSTTTCWARCVPASERPAPEAGLTLESLSGRRVGVWGAGVEGVATVAALRALPVPPSALVVVDDGLTPARAAAWLGGSAGDLPVLSGEPGHAALAASEIVVKSPGISRHLPLVDALRSRGVLVTGGTALWMAGCRGRGVVGITGSKGKSTTSTLLAHLMRSLGLSVRLGGNLGDPLLGLGSGTGGDDWVVAELSSFQCAEVHHSPAVGMLTALFPDHLDWHGTAASYYDDKLNLFRHDPGVVALNASDPTVRELAGEIPVAVWYGGQGGVHPEPGGTDVLLGSGRRVPTAGTALRGTHNLVNLSGALTALAACGVDLDARAEDLTAAVASFSALDHRLETVSRARGLEWVDDGLATNPDAAAAALTAFPGRAVTLLVGGHDRGVDYAVLGRAVATREAPTTVLTMPDNGPRIAAALAAQGVPSTACEDLGSAVRHAADATPAGGVVLLSPAAPSFGVYRDYRDRGAAFRAAIAGLSPAPG